MYSWNAVTSQWDRMGQDIDGENSYDYSGESVSLSGDGTILAIGAPYNDGNGESVTMKERMRERKRKRERGLKIIRRSRAATKTVLSETRTLERERECM